VAAALPEVFSIDGQALDRRADEIIEMLAEVVSFHVQLFDLERRRAHLRTSARSWFSHDIVGAEKLADAVITPSHESQSVFVRINRRWILRVGTTGPRVHDDGFTVTYGKDPPLSVEHLALAERAAEMLGCVLPAPSNASEVAPPAGSDGGGGSGSAELGIPVWWARKARN
jgi:hypothetical protein